MTDDNKYFDIQNYMPVFQDDSKDEIFARPLLHLAAELEKLKASELTPAQQRSVAALSRLAGSLCLQAANIRLCESLPVNPENRDRELILTALLAKICTDRSNLVCDLDPGLPLAVSCDCQALEQLWENLSFLAACRPEKVMLSLHVAAIDQEAIWLQLQLRPRAEAKMMEGDHPAYNLALAAIGRLCRRLSAREVVLSWPRRISCLLPLRPAVISAKSFPVSAAAQSVLVVCRCPALRLYLGQILRLMQLRVFTCEDGPAACLLLERQRRDREQILYVLGVWQLADISLLLANINSAERARFKLGILCAAAEMPRLPLSFFNLYLPPAGISVFDADSDFWQLQADFAAWLSSEKAADPASLPATPAENTCFDLNSGLYAGLGPPAAGRLLHICSRKLPLLLEQVRQGSGSQRQTALRDMQAAAVCLGAPALARACRSYLELLEQPHLEEAATGCSGRLTAETAELMNSLASTINLYPEVPVRQRKITPARWQQDLRRLARLLQIQEAVASRRLCRLLLEFYLPASRRLGIELILARLTNFDFAAAARLTRFLIGCGSRVEIDTAQIYTAAEAGHGR